MRKPKFRKVWIDTDKTDGKPGPWKRGWRRVRPVLTWRQKMKRAMNWGLANEPQIHYLQQRPFNPKSIANRDLPLFIDCSASTTQLYYDAGRPDPNKNDYDGTGFTGTLRRTPQRKSLKNARVGDFIIYGRGSGDHVVVVYKSGKNPKVWSHGQEAGPLLTDHSVQVAVHGTYFTVHNGGLLR